MKREKIFFRIWTTPYISGKIKDSKYLFYSSISKLKETGADMKFSHKVLDINFENKFFIVINL